MTRQDLRSIGSTILVTLTIVSGVAVSARLYKENRGTQKAEAAMASSTVACALNPEVQTMP